MNIHNLYLYRNNMMLRDSQIGCWENFTEGWYVVLVLRAKIWNWDYSYVYKQFTDANWERIISLSAIPI